MGVAALGKWIQALQDCKWFEPLCKKMWPNSQLHSPNFQVQYFSIASRAGIQVSWHWHFQHQIIQNHFFGVLMPAGELSAFC